MTGHADTIAEPFDWDPGDAAVLADQLRAYDALRARCPVARSEDLGWSALRHAEVLAVLDAHATFSSVVSAEHPAVPSGFDPPQHTGYRRIVDHYFTPAQMARFEPGCRRLAADFAAALPRGEVFDFMDWALEFALQAQCLWLDWPQQTADALRHWMARNQAATAARDRAAQAQVAADFEAAVGAVVADRRANPRPDDVTTELIAERVDGVPLSDAEIVSIIRNWTAGELGTIAASVGIIAEYLARHPALQQALRREPGGLSPVIDEMLRIHPPLIANRRRATREVELGGRRIEDGDRVTVLWASANRDESVFGDPDEFAPVRNAEHNLLYGRGIHDCPGAPLARLELVAVTAALLAGTTSIELAGAPARASYPGSGFTALPLRIS